MADDNPFAPSNADAPERDEERVDTLDPVPMDVGDVLSRSWYVFTNNLGVVIAAIVAIIAPGFVFAATGALLDVAAAGMDSDMALAVQFVRIGNDLLSQLVTLFFTLGAVRVFLHVTRGQEAEVGMIVAEGRSFLPAFGAQLLIGLALLLSVSPGLAAMGAAGAGALGLETASMVFGANVLVMMIPWVVVAMGLQFVQYVIVDRGVGPIDAIKESWRLTDGYKMTIFFINFLAGLLGLVVMCFTLGIGYLLFLPVLMLMQGVMYHSLTHYQGLVDDPW